VGCRERGGKKGRGRDSIKSRKGKARKDREGEEIGRQEGKISILARQKHLYWCNVSLTIAWQKLTIAHEYRHFVLHTLVLVIKGRGGGREAGKRKAHEISTPNFTSSVQRVAPRHHCGLFFLNARCRFHERPPCPTP